MCFLFKRKERKKVESDGKKKKKNNILAIRGDVRVVGGVALTQQCSASDSWLSLSHSHQK